jgi:hypothetical protein
VSRPAGFDREVGASAGLNPLMDRFSYRYDDGQHVGDAAPVHACMSPTTSTGSLASTRRSRWRVRSGRRWTACDAVDMVGAVLDAVPAGVAPVVYHSWALTYIERARRTAFTETLSRAASRRGGPVWWVSMEGPGVVPDFVAPSEWPTVLGLSRVDPSGEIEHRVLAQCHPYGRWVRWVS